MTSSPSGSGAAPSPPHCFLLDLPDELLRTIAAHLSKRSAAALALTCRALQEIGESVVWHDLSLTDRDLLLTASSPCTFLSQTYIPSPPIPTCAPMVITSSASQILMQTLLALLKAHPWRATQLRSLILDLRHELPSTLLDVLTLATALERLELRSPAPSFTISSYSLTATLDLFRSLPSPLPSLRHLRLDVRYRWNETVTEIVDRVPNLESLHILSHPRRISGGVPAIRSKLIPRTTLPRLRELIVDEMEQSFVPTLTPLIQGAKQLEAVALRDHAHRWRPTTGCPLVVALMQRDRLKRLECTSHLFPSLSLLGAFESLEALSMLWSTDLAFSHKKPDLIIPPLPNLQRYQLDISLHASSTDVDLHRHMLILPQVAQSILCVASTHLYACPKLTTLYLPPHLDYQSRQHQICPPPPDPNSEEFTGMIINSFTPPGSKDGSEIIHCRARLASEYPLRRHPQGWAEPYDDGVGAWKEQVLREDGTEMPLSVLSAMYSAAGIKVGELERSREGVLPEVSWSILRRWELQQDVGF